MGFFSGVLGDREARELSGEDAGSFGEPGLRGFFEDERDATAPGFDQVDAAEQVSDEGVAAAGDFAGFECAQGDAFQKRAGIAHLDAVGKNGDADFVGIPIVAVAKGVDNGFAAGFAVDLGGIDAGEALEFHADPDVLEDVFFSFLDEGEDVAGEVVLVDDGGRGGGGENGATEREGGRFGEEDAGGIQEVPAGVQSEAFQCGEGIGPWESRLADIGADFGGIGLEGGVQNGFGVPAVVAAIFPQNEGFDFPGRKLAVFIGDAHVGAAMGIVGFVAAGEADADAGFAGSEDFGNFGKDLGLDVGGDGLGDFPQCGLGDIHADGGAIVFDSEPEFAGAMLVEYGSHGGVSPAYCHIQVHFIAAWNCISMLGGF